MKKFRRNKPKWETKVIGSLDDDDSSSSNSFNSESTKQSKELESALHDAIKATEKRTGSLVVFQKATKGNVIDLGRQISALSADNIANATGGGDKDDDDDDNNSIQSSLNDYSMRSEPVFIKVESCEPSVLRQLSWETMSDASSFSGASSYDDDDDDDDNKSSNTDKNKERKRSSKSRSTSRKKKVKARKWDKLRRNINRQEKENNDELKRNRQQQQQEQQQQSSNNSNYGDSGTKQKLKFFRRRPKPNGKTTKTQYAVTMTRKTDDGISSNSRRFLENNDFDDEILEGNSFEVIAYNSTDNKGGFGVLPPFPSKMI